jgi:hypothetical protein
MSKEKQTIEEMAKDVTYSIVWDSDGYAAVDCLATAKKLHLKGYRKQSEVAREIFEEIDVLVNDWKNNYIQSIQFIAELADLKKKYTKQSGE